MQTACASALACTRQANPSQVAQRRQALSCGLFSSITMRIGSGKGRWPARARSSESCWIRGSCDTPGTGTGRRRAVRPGRCRAFHERDRAARPRCNTARNPGRQRPFRRYAAGVPHRAEIALAQSQQDRTVHLRVAADPVVNTGMEWPADAVAPGLRSLIPVRVEHRVATPILLLTRQEVAAFEDQDALTGRRQMVGERAAPRRCRL